MTRASPRRAVQNHRGKAVRLNSPAQELPFSENMLLPGVFPERARPHPCGKRCIGWQCRVATRILPAEKILHALSMMGVHFAGKATASIPC